MGKAEAFVAAARAMIGTPWVHQGRAAHGVDCVGLIVLSARSIGIEAPMDASYGRLQDYRQARRYLEAFCVRVGSPEIGDIVLYKTSQSLHMAIISLVSDGRPRHVIQAHGPKGAVVESGLSFPPMMLWRPKWPS